MLLSIATMSGLALAAQNTGIILSLVGIVVGCIVTAVQR